MILASPAPKTFLGFCAFSCSRCVSKLNGISMVILNGPRREETCLRGFRQSDIQNSLLSYID